MALTRMSFKKQKRTLARKQNRTLFRKQNSTLFRKKGWMLFWKKKLDAKWGASWTNIKASQKNYFLASYIASFMMSKIGSIFLLPE